MNVVLKRHDKVAQIIHYNLCKKFDLSYSRNWYDHVEKKVAENSKAKILLDFSKQTDHVIQAQRPDIVFKDN